MCRRLCAFAIVAYVLATARVVWADIRRAAIVVGASASDPSALQISDELRAMGLEVEVVPHDSDRPRLRKRARSGDTDAVVLVSDREIEVLVAVDGEVQVQYIARRGDSDTSTSALAAVEVVRGLLVPVGAPRDKVTAPVGPPVAVQVEDRRAYVRVGLGFMMSAMPTQQVATLGGGWWFGPAGLEVTATAALTGTDLEPSSPLWTGALGIAFHYALLDRRRRISVLVSGGVAGLLLYFRDDKGKWNGEGAAVPYLGVGLRARIAGGVVARLDGIVGVVTPEPAFDLKSGEIASFGTTAQQLTAGVELSW